MHSRKLGDPVKEEASDDALSGPEDGEIDERPKSFAMPLDVVSKSVKQGVKDVAQRNVRYFMINQVVCENCGMRGHVSMACDFTKQQKRCSLCGAKGHHSRECPHEICYICKRPGHHRRDCPTKKAPRDAWRQVKKRDVPPARPTRFSCYVCGRRGHLDCGLLRIKKGTLSCHNCGQRGHTGLRCQIPSVDRIVPIVLEMERERKEKDRERKIERKKEKKRRAEDREEGEEEQEEGALIDEVGLAAEYRRKIMERARMRRYGGRR